MTAIIRDTRILVAMPATPILLGWDTIVESIASAEREVIYLYLHLYLYP